MTAAMAIVITSKTSSPATEAPKSFYIYICKIDKNVTGLESLSLGAWIFLGIGRLIPDLEVDGSNRNWAYSSKPGITLWTVLVSNSPRNFMDYTAEKVMPIKRIHPK